MITTELLLKMIRDFQADQADGFVSNDEIWVKAWIAVNLKKELFSLW